MLVGIAHSHAGVELVDHRAIQIAELLPGARMMFSYVIDKRLGCRRNGQFRMNGRHDSNVKPHPLECFILLFHSIMREQEDNNVDDNERESHNRPTPGRHILMTNWNQHERSFPSWIKEFPQVYPTVAPAGYYQSHALLPLCFWKLFDKDALRHHHVN